MQNYVQTEWEAHRLGKFSASSISKLLTEPQSKAAKEAGELSQTAKTYIFEKAAEILTGTKRSLSTFSTEWGNTYEPECAALIDAIYPEFTYHGQDNPKWYAFTPLSGGSPDGVAGSQIVFEFKCPENPAFHVESLLMKSGDDLLDYSKEYYYQLQFNMACVGKANGIEFSDMLGVFASYSPIMRDERLRLHHFKVKPDLAFYSVISDKIARAEKHLAQLIKNINILTL